MGNKHTYVKLICNGEVIRTTGNDRFIRDELIKNMSSKDPLKLLSFLINNLPPVKLTGRMDDDLYKFSLMVIRRSGNNKWVREIIAPPYYVRRRVGFQKGVLYIQSDQICMGRDCHGFLCVLCKCQE